MSVVTRFAPSPTGFLHIGGARTALFNWLFARHHGGQFLLRIEDTDRARSTQQAVDAIFDGIKWLGLDWDGEAVFQFARMDRHAEVARQLVAEGKAYYCYCTPEELEKIREQQRAEGKPMRYPGIWRDRDPSEAPAGAKAVVRLKAPQDGDTVIHDLVQGEVRVVNSQLDDMVLLRADGTPTYMLSVVVDDHDMGITHVIRGDDHLTNAFRQYQLYKACGWDIPQFAHIPLIHGPDGAKLSKRHGALGAEAYRDMGFLPEAMRNYLLRLGWGHGDDEIIPTEQAVEWFDLAGVGRSPSRFDMTKLTNLNGHYLRQSDDSRLVDLIAPMVEAKVGAPVDAEGRRRLTAGMAGMKERAKTLVELADSALFYVRPRPLALDDKAAKALDDSDARALLRDYVQSVAESEWTKHVLEEAARTFAESRGQKLGKVAQPLRAALTGSSVSPPIFEVMEVLGRAEATARIEDITGKDTP
ncbi:glutamate--tRNA ligase [Magnetospirillum aberrantis]|uniref:Glutamate--tRNA ligase n=1 Tax=Magnetospirillum aberrantis SpK TaxID=908842 RepID=A0A7C9QSZ4_9PROT|nr:glutamate--tRNA ligase [Magnetospirillum aberrantis]NFV79439.1 glutamate--tRNA ligase [Magnetospirillum aberrantis SpK]